MTQPQPEDHEQLQIPKPNASGTRKRLAGLNVTHLLADLYGGFPAPLLRTFGSHLAVSYASVSLLLGLNSIAGGIGAIVMGLDSDRRRHATRRMVLLTAAVTVVAMSTLGLASSYWMLMIVMAVGAFACGAFHPPGFSAAGDLTHPHRARGVSIIMAAGIAGAGLGPLFVTYMVRNHGGIRATALCAPPGIALLAVAAVLLGRRRQAATHDAPRAEPEPRAVPQAVPAGQVRHVLLLFANASLRAFTQMSVLVLVSKLMEDEWGLSVLASGVGVGALQIGMGVGGLIGAKLTPPGGERRTMLAHAPLTALVLLPMAFASGRIWWLLLLVYGLCNNGPGAVVVSFAQHIAPNRRALVSGLMIGVAFAAGGPLAAIASPRIFDHFGQAYAMGILLLPLALCWLTAALLPAGSRPGASDEA